MVGDLVLDIGLVEGGAVELVELGAFIGRRLRQRLAVSLSSGVTLSFLTRSSACTFTASWSRTMSLAKSTTVLVLGFGDRQLGRLDVDDAGGIGDVRDLRIGGLVCGLRQRREASEAKRGQLPRWVE